MLINGIHCAQREHRQQRQRQIRRAPHFFTRRRQHRRQALPAKLGRRTQPRPARFAKFTIRRRQISVRVHFALCQLCAVHIARAVGVCPRLLGKLGGFVQHRRHSIRIQRQILRGGQLQHIGEFAVGAQGEIEFV